MVAGGGWGRVTDEASEIDRRGLRRNRDETDTDKYETRRGFEGIRRKRQVGLFPLLHHRGQKRRSNTSRAFLLYSPEYDFIISCIMCPINVIISYMYVMSWNVSICQHMSCHFMSRHVIICHVLLCLVLSCYVVSSTRRQPKNSRLPNIYQAVPVTNLTSKNSDE